MILHNDITVQAPPDEVFGLLGDVRRVVTAVPGASITGGDGGTYQGEVKIKVGPITAAYAGTVRFLEFDTGRRYLKLQATGSDTRGSGDAEAQVELTVTEAPHGATLTLATDLLVRGKIAQFGKGAIATVSAKLLAQFATNLAGLLDQQPATTDPAATTAEATPATHLTPAIAPAPALDGASLLIPPSVRRCLPIAAALAFGVVEGWLLGTLAARTKQLKEVRRG